MYAGLSHAAWGYFFLNFDFNLGTVSIFPRFVGYILFFLAITKLADERRDLKLLRPLCILLGLWSAGDWALSWGGGDIDGHVLFLDLLIAAAGLYFQFQLLTDMAALAETYQEGDLDARLRRRRTVYVVLVTVTALISALPEGTLLGDWQSWIAVGLTLIACVVSLTIMAGLFQLRRCFRAPADAPPEI